jgi:hypothetical protein
VPAELQRIHHIVLDDPIVEIVTDEMRAVVERLWPELAVKLPPRPAATVDPPQVRECQAVQEYVGAPIALGILLAIALAGLCNLFMGWW